MNTKLTLSILGILILASTFACGTASPAAPVPAENANGQWEAKYKHLREQGESHDYAETYADAYAYAISEGKSAAEAADFAESIADRKAEEQLPKRNEPSQPPPTVEVAREQTDSTTTETDSARDEETEAPTPSARNSADTSTTEPTPVPSKSAEYLERYEAIYAELRAEGESPEVADLYATAYADQRERGKSHEYATSYADLRTEGDSEIYATAFADQIEMGMSDTFAVAYAVIYATLYHPAEEALPFQGIPFQGIKDKQAYVNTYAEQVELGKTYQYAYAYSLKIDAGEPVIIADAYARGYDRLRNMEELEWDEAIAYADIYMSFYEFYLSHNYANPEDFAEDYTDAYLEQLSEGKSHDYAVAYADCKTGNCGELNTKKLIASYASQRELGESKAYAYAYSIARAEDKSPDEAQALAERYETTYNDEIANGKTHFYAHLYAYLRIVSGWAHEAAADEAKWSEQGYREHVAVSAGGDHSCGALESGNVVCWGSDYHVRTRPPDGRFKAISTSWSHSCGILEGALQFAGAMITTVNQAHRMAATWRLT